MVTDEDVDADVDAAGDIKRLGVGATRVLNYLLGRRTSVMAHTIVAQHAPPKYYGGCWVDALGAHLARQR